MNAYEKISNIFEALSTPARLQILIAISKKEACVCHLEALLGLRQAYISQQLMIFREKKLITARREGKYIYYRLRNPEVLVVILSAARAAGLPKKALDVSNPVQCSCPSCSSTIPISQVLPVSEQK